jgi:hypothetical protein
MRRTVIGAEEPGGATSKGQGAIRIETNNVRIWLMPDPINDISDLQRIEQLQQGRLVQGHRVHESFRENHWRGLADHHTVAPPT